MSLCATGAMYLGYGGTGQAVDGEGAVDRSLICAVLGGSSCFAPSSRADRAADQLPESERKSSARIVAPENYSGVGSFGETNAITALGAAKPTGRQPHVARAAYPQRPVLATPPEGGE
jgi:hypothetical protein